MMGSEYSQESNSICNSDQIGIIYFCKRSKGDSNDCGVVDLDCCRAAARSERVNAML